MPDSNADPLARNRGLITDDEQQLLRSARVLVAGVGGVGGRTAETLVRLGVGHLRLTDPDQFCVSNLNRQAGATTHTLGHNKAAAIAELCADAGTGTDVEFFDAGVTTTNVAAMLTDVDLVVDAIDYTVPHLALSLAREARARRIPVITAVEVGYSVWQTALLPEAVTFERFYGLPDDVLVDDVAHGIVRIPLWRLAVRLPNYADLAVFKEVEAGRLAAPALAPAVELSAAMLSTSAVALLTGHKVAAVAPKVHLVDLRTGRSWVKRPRYVWFLATVISAALSTRRRWLSVQARPLRRAGEQNAQRWNT